MNERHIFIILIAFFGILLLVISKNLTGVSGSNNGGTTGSPQQEIVRPPRYFPYQGATGEAVATYYVNARILSIKYYRNDTESTYAPVDLALGWGPMSDPKILKYFRITQDGRWYRWRSDSSPISREEVINNSANTHILPASQSVLQQIQQLNVGDTVELGGFLVNIRRGDWRWSTSLTRSDTGAGSCELFYVTSLR